MIEQGSHVVRRHTATAPLAPWEQDEVAVVAGYRYVRGAYAHYGLFFKLRWRDGSESWHPQHEVAEVPVRDATAQLRPVPPRPASPRSHRRGGRQ